MSDIIHIERLNEVYMRLNCEPALLREVGEFFSFLIPNHKFHPLVKSKVWNGRINLLDSRRGTLYTGLREHLRKFAEDRGYELTGLEQYAPEDVTAELDQFLGDINVPFELHDFQEAAFRHAIAHKSVTMLSATSSGKSLIIYLLARYMESISGRTLIIVPSVTLVNQLWSDFKEYSVDNGWNYDNCHKVTAGVCKTTDLPITISTWQSLQKLKDKAAFMSNFDMVVVDECHQSHAKELQSLLEAALHVPYRIGMTGTLQDAKANSWVIEGLLGPVLPVVKAAELMKQGKAAQITIRNIILKHSEDNCKLLTKATYQQEIDFLCANPARNKFIYNLTKSTRGNTLVLFRYVDKHGKELEKLLQETGKTVHFISGKTKGDVREQIRHILATETNSVLLASVGVLAVGVSIRNLHNLVLTAPSKSKIKILQSIGRMMRLMEGKTKATVYDLADDLIHKKHINYTLRHFQDRIQMYASEGFDYTIHKYSL